MSGSLNDRAVVLAQLAATIYGGGLASITDATSGPALRRGCLNDASWFLASAEAIAGRQGEAGPLPGRVEAEQAEREARIFQAIAYELQEHTVPREGLGPVPLMDVLAEPGSGKGSHELNRLRVALTDAVLSALGDA